MVKVMGAKLKPCAHEPGGTQQKPPRPAAQWRVLSSLSLSQPPGSNLIPVMESVPSRKKTRSRNRGKMRGVLFLLPVSISSAYAPYPGRHPPKLRLRGRGQTAGQSVIRIHLVSGGSARPQALSLAWHSYLILSLESPLKVGIIIPHLQKRKRSQARGPVQTTGFLNGRVGNWHQSPLLPNPAMIRSRRQGLPPSEALSRAGQSRRAVARPGLSLRQCGLL